MLQITSMAAWLKKDIKILHVYSHFDQEIKMTKLWNSSIWVIESVLHIFMTREMKMESRQIVFKSC